MHGMSENTRGNGDSFGILQLGNGDSFGDRDNLDLAYADLPESVNCNWKKSHFRFVLSNDKYTLVLAFVAYKWNCCDWLYYYLL